MIADIPCPCVSVTGWGTWPGHPGGLQGRPSVRRCWNTDGRRGWNTTRVGHFLARLGVLVLRLGQEVACCCPCRRTCPGLYQLHNQSSGLSKYLPGTHVGWTSSTGAQGMEPSARTGPSTPLLHAGALWGPPCTGLLALAPLLGGERGRQALALAGDAPHAAFAKGLFSNSFSPAFSTSVRLLAFQ